MDAALELPVRIADEHAALHAILHGTATVTGEHFFDALVVNLAKSLNTHSAWVTEYVEATHQLHVLAFWADGRLTKDFLIDITGTPCETVIRHSEMVHYPDQLIRLYPDNPNLAAIQASSYLGAPLRDQTGRTIGNLAVLDTRPMPADDHAKAVFQVFAARGSAELQRLLAERALRKSEEKYRRIVETTMDGFFLMDSRFAITDVNQAFCRMVGHGREDIIGRSPMRFAESDYGAYLMANKDEFFAQDLVEHEGTIVHRSGRKIPVLIHGTALRDAGDRTIGNMVFVIDLTLQKRSLSLAEEVQRSLLPQTAPAVPGLDIAARTLSCQEIGGDYYDYLWARGCPEDQFSVVVGDVAGHGVEAALLMATARAFLRMRAEQCGDVARLVTELNRNLARDVTDSGRFMTLAFVRFDLPRHTLTWVRAGHPPVLVYDPASDRFRPPPVLVYDPASDRFRELKGNGIPLGVEEGFSYATYVDREIGPGQIVVIGTDGIWEAFDRNRKPYGMQRFCEVIRAHAHEGAAAILEAVYADVKEYCLGAKQEDDITLVIARVEPSAPATDWMI
jgi:PAS domain S-box-containing protein